MTVVDGAPTRVRIQPMALVGLWRPRQWLKNALVFAAPGAAGVLTDADVIGPTLVAFAAMCLAASGIYCINDAHDAAHDRRHPTKRHRPVASGRVPVGLAVGCGIAFLTLAIAAGAAVEPVLGLVVAAYVAQSVAYVYLLKRVAVVDIVTIAGGFVLRALAGAAATGVPVSNWFFIVTSFGALLMAAGKRSAELVQAGEDAVEQRAVLAEYTPSFLQSLRTTSLGLVLIAYCLWAFERAAEIDPSIPLYRISIGPFAIALLRYSLLLDRGRGAAPEDAIFEDHVLLLAALAWAALFGVGVVIA